MTATAAAEANSFGTTGQIPGIKDVHQHTP